MKSAVVLAAQRYIPASSYGCTAVAVMLAVGAVLGWEPSGKYLCKVSSSSSSTTTYSFQQLLLYCYCCNAGSRKSIGVGT